MEWSVSYSKDAVTYSEEYPTPGTVIDAACRLLDSGYEVLGICTASLNMTVGDEVITPIYDIWQRTKSRAGC